jgi:hypothetical protein
MNLGNKMICSLKQRFVLLTFFCFGTSPLLAQTLLPPRFSSDVYASDRVFGQANAWLPFSGNTDQAWYLNPQVAYGADGQGYLDLGVGYRWLSNQKTLLGVYLFGGYSNIAENRNLWTVNPGIEILERRWDARINGYLINEKNQNLGYWFGYQVGRKNLQFKGYNVYDDLYFIRQHHGNGADARVGYQPWDQVPLKASLGGYFFVPDKVVKNVVGGVAELEYWLDQHFKLLVSYNYDNVRHSVGAIGLGIELGGTRRHRTVPQCVQERITDPIERNVAQQGQGSGVISQNTNYFMGPYPLTRGQYDDSNNGGGGGPGPGDPDPDPPPEPPPPLPPDPASFVYFSASGLPSVNTTVWTLASNTCTFENPCGLNDFTQDNVNAFAEALPNTVISFSPGTYPIYGSPTTDRLISLVAGQEIHGRTAGYTGPALPGNRPVLSGTLQLNTGNIVSDVEMIYPGGGAPTTGISLAEGAVDITIRNTQIGSSIAPFETGISSGGSSTPYFNQAMINNVDIFAGNLGISVGGPDLIISNSRLTVGGGAGVNSIGIRSTGVNATINVENVDIKVSSATATTLAGLQAGFLGTTMTANNVNIEVESPLEDAKTLALFIRNSSNIQPATLTVDASHLTSTNTNVAGSAYIVGGVSSGLPADNYSVLTINEGVLSVSVPNNLANAAIEQPGQNFTFNLNSSTCSINGSGFVNCP